MPHVHGPDLHEIPPGYRVTSNARARLATAAWAESVLEQADFGLESDGALVASDVRGRRPLEATPDGSILVRRFTHGGLLRFLSRRRFHDAARPFTELALSTWLTAHGVHTPPIAAARSRAAFAFGHELALATRRIDGARDLESYFVDVRAGRRARRDLRTSLHAFGALVARLHEIGFLHADLTPKNVLVEERGGESPRLWLIDLDRSRVDVPLSEPKRRDNLRRLWRFVDRRERRDGRALTRADVARFLVAYAPDRARRRAIWRAVAADHARLASWHRAGWILERFSGR